MHLWRILFILFSLCIVGLIAQNKKQSLLEFRHDCIHDTLQFEEAKSNQPLKLTLDPHFNRKRFVSQSSAPPLHEPIRIFLEPVLDNDPNTCYSVGQQVQTRQGTYSCTSQDILTVELRQYLIDIVNEAISILQGTLKVVRGQGNLVISTSTCGSNPPASVPQQYQTNGIPNADFALFLTARPIPSSGSSSSVLAFASSCLANMINRPIAGHANFNPSALNPDPDFRRVQVGVALHEISHALGYSASKFNQFIRWVNSTTFVSVPPSQVLSTVQSNTLNKQVTYMITPTAVSTVQSYFGCSSLPGLEIEDGGGSGTAGSHPEKRVFQNEYMSGSVTPFPIFSNITLSVFADSGWYEIDYTYAQSLVWGRGMGCNFALNRCVPPNWPSDNGYYCSDTSGLNQKCTFDRTGYGICNLVTYNQPLPSQFQYFSDPSLGGIDTLSDYCPYTQSNTLCIQSYGSGNSALGRNLNDLAAGGETYCPTCRCFSSSLGKPTGLTPTNRCYNVTCAAPDDLRVKVDGIWYSCPYGGGSIKDVVGYGGEITCDARLADTLCLQAPMVPADQWPIYESISPSEGSPGSQVTITGRNFMLTSSMSVTIGAPCTNVVVNSDTELVATIADSSNFGDPIYLTRPKLAVVITDARGLTDYRKDQYVVVVTLNSDYFAALGEWIKNNPVWFVLILLAFLIPIACLIYCCRKCCKKRKKSARVSYPKSSPPEQSHTASHPSHTPSHSSHSDHNYSNDLSSNQPVKSAPSVSSIPSVVSGPSIVSVPSVPSVTTHEPTSPYQAQNQQLNYDPSNPTPYFTAAPPMFVPVTSETSPAASSNPQIQSSPSQPSNPTSGQVVVVVPSPTQETQMTTFKNENDVESQSDPSEVSIPDQEDYSQNSESSSENV